VPALALVEVQQVGLELRGHFVLAGLARHHDGELMSLAGEDRSQDGAGGCELVGSQGPLEDETGEEADVGKPVFDRQWVLLW